MPSRRKVLRLAAATAAASAFPLAACDPPRRPRARPAGPRLASLGIRPAEERGRADHGWLDARHTFSFARYHDPNHMGFRGLRVLNEDRIAGGGGFPMHPHREMEIVTYVLEGALEHEDSLGNGGIIRPDLVQRMSAGTGIRHSEFNPSASADTHLLQIWILPDERGVRPSYEERKLAHGERRGRWRVIASPDGRHGSIRYHTDAFIHAAVLSPGQRVAHEVAAGRGGWVQIARGGAVINGHRLGQGDGAFTRDAGRIEVEATADAELLLFDLA